VDKGTDLNKQIRKNRYGDWRGTMRKWEWNFGVLCHACALRNVFFVV
jgi:hypothetical protein